MDLCPPPADADEQETRVVEEFRRLELESVADELKNPSDEEQRECVQPQPVEEDAGYKKRVAHISTRLQSETQNQTAS